MMVSPDYLKSEWEKLPYEELVAQRDELLSYIREFEEHKLDESAYKRMPSPDTVYEMNLEYLGVLAPLIAEKHNDLRMDD